MSGQISNTPVLRPRTLAFNAMLMIVLAGVLIRILLSLVHPLTFPDSLDYLHLATCVEHGDPYRVTGMYAKRLPGYPIFMAGVLLLDGGREMGILICQAILSGWMIYLVWRIGCRIDPMVGLLAAAMAAFDPLLIGFSASYLSEIPFTAIFVFTLLVFVRLCERDERWGLACTLGILFALCIYIRAEIALCIFPLLIWYIFMAIGTQRWRRIVQSLVIVLIIVAGMMPWWIRNWELFHSNFFRFSTLEGISLYESVYHGATGGPRQSDIKWPAYMKKLNESQRDNRWTAMSFRIIEHHPIRILRLAVIKIGRTWSPWLHAKGFRNIWVNGILTIWYGLEYLLAIFGVRRLWKDHSKVLLGITLIPIFYLTAMHAIFLGSVRYRVPLIPLIGLLAAVGLGPIISAFQKRCFGANCSGG
jgi:4-amino-4-deoxy-L-arabinose transferase-like glycosyltransferase